MEEIIQDYQDIESREAEYLRAVTRQKQLQKSGNSTKELAKSQKDVLKLGRKYARKLIEQMMNMPSFIRKYAAGERYTLEYITSVGQIVIYSHPQNLSVKPKIEVHHVGHGFIAWWNEDEFSEEEQSSVWKKLCLRCSFDPADAIAVINENERVKNLY